MEQNPIINPQQPVPPGKPEIDQPKKRSMLPIFLLLGFAVLIVAGFAGWAVTRNNESQNENQTTKEPVVPLANNTIVYGYWTTEASIINAYDLSTRTNIVLATLPQDIKHLKILSPKKISYIKNVNERDHGTELVVRSLDTQAETIVMTAEQGFGIDDYKVSPDGNNFAVWQVDPPTDSGPVRGGRSIVVTTNITSPGQNNVIHSESTNMPVNYPVAVTDAGEVFTDKFQFGADAGWAYGMSVSNFTGDTKEDLTVMEGGTFSTQPIQSPDGNRLVFAGYDGSKGNGNTFSDGYRRAIANPNSVEILDLTSRARSKIIGSEEAIYPSAYWDTVTGNPIFTVLSRISEDTGTYTVDTVTQQVTKLTVANSNPEQQSAVFAKLNDNKLLLANEAVEESTIGNLGERYAPAISAMYVADSTTGEQTRVDLNGELVQLISIKDAQYFASIKDQAQILAQKDKQLQIQSFTMKPKLASTRIAQQSGERCRDVAAAQCNSLLGTNFDGDTAKAKQTGNEEFAACFQDLFRGPGRQTLGSCSDSPLYLYGEEGTKVTLVPLTPIFSTNISYNRGESIDIELDQNGKFHANGSLIQSLSFDYTPAIKRLVRPSKGVVVSVSEIQEKAQEFSAKLGLNAVETIDTVSYIISNATGPYVYLSFYDNEMSREILPLHFDPQPDNYRNIVFYLENLEEPLNASIDLPVFEKVQRGGLTAVEISFIVR